MHPASDSSIIGDFKTQQRGRQRERKKKNNRFYTAVSRKVVGKVHATIPKGIVGGFEFSVLQRNLKELAQKPMEMCLRALKESNKSGFDSYRRQEQCIDHIPYCLSGLSRAHRSREILQDLSWLPACKWSIQTGTNQVNPVT